MAQRERLGNMTEGVTSPHDSHIPSAPLRLFRYGYHHTSTFDFYGQNVTSNADTSEEDKAYKKNPREGATGGKTRGTERPTRARKELCHVI
jgi:hypothetical protein